MITCAKLQTHFDTHLMCLLSRYTNPVKTTQPPFHSSAVISILFPTLLI